MQSCSYSTESNFLFPRIKFKLDYRHFIEKMDKKLIASRKLSKQMLIKNIFLLLQNTWYLFSPTELYEMIGPLGVSLVHLLAYISCCCNPITLCVMSRGFRIAFCHVFGCHCDSQRHPTSASQRNDSVRLTRNRSLYTPTFHKTTDHV